MARKPGPKRDPTELRKRKGNPQRRPIEDDDEPKPEIGAPSPPSHLGKAGRAEWNRIVPYLLTVRLLTDLDRAALAAYCQLWERWCQAERAIRRKGAVINTPNGFPVQSPWLQIASKCLEQMRHYLVEFGMTPSARSGLKVPSVIPPTGSRVPSVAPAQPNADAHAPTPASQYFDE